MARGGPKDTLRENCGGAADVASACPHVPDAALGALPAHHHDPSVLARSAESRPPASAPSHPFASLREVAPVVDAGRPRVFLFLQGLASSLFSQLGDELAARGHGVRRINFNGGDQVFWRRPGAIGYRGGRERWPTFVRARMREWGVTDLLLFGDCRPLHRDAIAVAGELGIAVHVFEEGYLRPNWITLERNGVNARSSLPRDPRWFERAAAALPPAADDLPMASSFGRRAWEDVVYNVSSLLLSISYPRYRTHRPWHPLVEYAGWIWRLMRAKADRRRSNLKVDALKADGRPYFLHPLQLDCDTQIRVHSGFRRLAPAIEHVIGSFAAHAPADTLLVIKEHPFDNRLTDWSRVIRRAAQADGVADRVIFLEDALLDAVLPGAQGVVTVNSTVGLLALTQGLPTKVLGTAIYDLPGLTHRDGLASFWTAPTPPRPDLVDAFRRVVAARSQINGGFFSDEALAVAVQQAADRLELSAG